MKILSVVGENFMSFDRFFLELDNRGLVLVHGENVRLGGGNGAGKTAMFDAITWCSWRKLADQAKTLRSTEVSKHQNGNCVVSTTYQVEDTYVLIKRYCQHSDYGNKVRVFSSTSLEGLESKENERTLGTDRDTQKVIDEYLGMDFATFMSVVMFPQGATGFAAKTSGEMDSVLASVLRTERFTDARVQVKEAYDSAYRMATNTEQKLRTAVAVLGQISADRDVLAEKNEAWDALQIGRIRTLGSILADRDREFRQHPEPNGELEHQAQVLLAQMEDQPVLDLVEQAKVRKQTAERDQATALATMKSLERQVRTRTHSMIGDPDALAKSQNHCPACDRPLDTDTTGLAEHYRSENRQILVDIENHNSAREQEQVKAVNAQVVIDAANDVLTQAAAFLAKVRDQEREVFNLGHQLIAERQQVQHLKARFDAATADFERLQTESNPYENLLEQKVAQQKAQEQVVADLKKAQAPLAEDMRYFGFLNDMFSPSGVKAFLIETVIPYLDERANFYMEQLTNASGHISFSTEQELKSGASKDKFNIQVSYDEGCGMYGGVSGGERRRADLAILLALGDLAAARAPHAVELRLLDEPFHGLDAVPRQRFTDILRAEILPKVGTILVMTHDEDQKEMFEDRLLVRKEGGNSRLI